MARQSILKNKEAVEASINQSNCIKECLENLGLRAAGGNYKSFHRACSEFNLTPPTIIGTPLQTEAARNRNTIPIETILVVNSKYENRSQIKKRLIKSGLLIEICSKCGLGPEWNNHKLTLQLDHINGIYNDHRLENLRLLCPNCHSQTPTYAGRKTTKTLAPLKALK